MPDQESATAPDVTEMQRTSRDPERLRQRLEAWFASRLPAGADPVVPGLEGTARTGMSSDTLLFDLAWTEDGRRRTDRLVARVAPDLSDIPVFPSYDMVRQFEVIRLQSASYIKSVQQHRFRVHIQKVELRTSSHG